MALQHQDVWAGQGLSAFGGGEEGAGVGLPAALPSSLHAGGGHKGSLSSPWYSEKGGLPKGPLTQSQVDCWHPSCSPDPPSMEPIPPIKGFILTLIRLPPLTSERSRGVGTAVGGQESAPGCGLPGPTHAERNPRAKDAGDFTPACSYLWI